MHAADILIVTVLPEEYSAMVSHLTDARSVQGTADAPNTHAWRLGTIAHEGGGAYSVAVALVGGAGNVNASQAVASSVARWKPRHVLLVGIAGGLSTAGCVVGDVVVATEVYGYEYGKLDGGFHARANWTYQVDVALRASAQGFAAANPGWAGSVGGPPPRILFGPVASGDKVVDDPSDPVFAAVLRVWPKLHAVEMEGAGAAAAIEHLHATGTRVGFLIVRGISDTPRTPDERAAAGAQTGERDANKRRACEVAARFVARWIATEWPIAPSSGLLAEVESAPAQRPPGDSRAIKAPSQSRPANDGHPIILEPSRVSRLEAANEPIPVELSASFSIQKMYRDSSQHVYRHDYLGTVRLVNRGSAIIRVWGVEVEFPAILASANVRREARNDSVCRRLTSDDRKEPIYPEKCIDLAFVYTMNDSIYWAVQGTKKAPFKLRAFIDDRLVIQESIPFEKMQNF